MRLRSAVLARNRRDVTRQRCEGSRRCVYRTNVFEPISLSKIRMATGSANKSLGDKVAYRQSVTIPIFRKRIESVALLSVFYPNLLIAKCTNQIQICI